MAKAGLWVLNSNPSQNLNERNIPIADQIKNHYNTAILENAKTNLESTFETDAFDRAESSNSNQSYRNQNTPTFRNTLHETSPHFGNQQKIQDKNQYKHKNNQNESNKTGYSKTGFGITFSHENQ